MSFASLTSILLLSVMVAGCDLPRSPSTLPVQHYRQPPPVIHTDKPKRVGRLNGDLHRGADEMQRQIEDLQRQVDELRGKVPPQ